MEHPGGLSDRVFDVLFRSDMPIVFPCCGHSWLNHRLAYRRTNHADLPVRAYKEASSTTMPLDMAVLNEIDPFDLAGAVIDRVPSLGTRAAYAKQCLRDNRLDHTSSIRWHSDDMPEIREWKWAANSVGGVVSAEWT